MDYIKRFIGLVSKSEDKERILTDFELYIIENMTPEKREALLKAGELFLELTEDIRAFWVAEQKDRILYHKDHAYKEFDPRSLNFMLDVCKGVDRQIVDLVRAYRAENKEDEK